jgi:hypothetical protein
MNSRLPSAGDSFTWSSDVDQPDVGVGGAVCGDGRALEDDAAAVVRPVGVVVDDGGALAGAEREAAHVGAVRVHEVELRAGLSGALGREYEGATVRAGVGFVVAAGIVGQAAEVAAVERGGVDVVVAVTVGVEEDAEIGHCGSGIAPPWLGADVRPVAVAGEYEEGDERQRGEEGEARPEYGARHGDRGSRG